MMYVGCFVILLGIAAVVLGCVLGISKKETTSMHISATPTPAEQPELKPRKSSPDLYAIIDPKHIPRILYLILHTIDAVDVRHMIESTWLRGVPDNNYAFLVNDPTLNDGDFRFSDHVLRIGGLKEEFGAITEKAYRAYVWAASIPDWDYVVRTNNGTYIQPQFLSYILAHTPIEFGGTVGMHEECQFVSGCNTVMSRATVRKLVDFVDNGIEPEESQAGLLDDCWVGRILIKRLGVRPVELPREEWVDGDVTQLTKHCWAYRISQPYGDNYRLIKFKAIYDFLHADPDGQQTIVDGQIQQN